MRGVEKLMTALLIAMAIIIPACVQKESKSTGDAQPALKESQVSQPQTAEVKTESGLVYQEIQVGTGPQPASGKRVKVHYTGWLENGTKFDSSVDRGEPFVFTIGTGEVIPGWDEGVLSMKIGGKRKLKVPSRLGYGASGAGGVIPPNANLIFDVELLDVEK